MKQLNYGPFYESVVFFGQRINLLGNRDACGAWYRSDDRRLEVRTLDSLGSLPNDGDETFAMTAVGRPGYWHRLSGDRVRRIDLQAAVDELEKAIRHLHAQLAAMIEDAEPAIPGGVA